MQDYLKDFNVSIDYWIDELSRYDLDKLLIQPAPGQWSLGQLYHHLIDDTEFYLQQIGICFSGTQDQAEQAKAPAQRMFQENTFPDIRITGAPDHATMPQPSGSDMLMDKLIAIRKQMNLFADKFPQSATFGKTKHPGLGYFSAAEWLQFAAMHFRHHLRQKIRIDAFLSGQPT
jgi:hypothetical protein